MADRYHRPTRPPTRREALGPGDSRANIDPSTKRSHAATKKTTSSSPQAPTNNQNLMPTSASDARSTSPAATSPRNERLSAIVEDSQRKAKRNSEISNASTTASGSKRKSFVGRWQLGKTIGKGGCSTVRLVRHKDTGQIGAAKIISRKMAESVRAQSLANLADNPERSLQDLVAAGKAMPPPPPGLLREIAIMKLLDHDNIVQLFDVWENHNELYLIMEYVEGGELFHYVEECQGLSELESVYIFRQIVAAMLYCHRIHIHHRDLKPENILIDRQTRRIKLVDFGMAALQPVGKKLTTACGSPHYAAPEVIRSKPYDGAQADVWSCGVILYVMLTGMTPFNYDKERNLHVMYQAIADANYYMPPELTAQAQDLLRRIFVPDPRRRITMDEVWEHPFLHKFDEDWGYTGVHALKEAWIGPSPMLNEWTVSDADDIDKEILRNMQTLWHSVPRQLLVKKLLSREPNQEKYFYAALLKHREENLENYYGGTDAMSYAASDYQHNSRDTSDIPPVPQGKQQSQSQYSILNDEHLRSSRSFAQGGPPSSASSYDPYRPSRYRMTPEGTSYTKVTVHRRGESNGTRKAHIQHTFRQTNSNRVEALRKGGRNVSSSTLSKQSSHRISMSRNSLGRTSISRNSTASSIWPSSPPVAMPVRAVTSHKRGVSFSHLRQSSTTNTNTEHDNGVHPPITPELRAKARFSQQAHSDRGEQVSPSERAETVVRSKKEKGASSGVKARSRKSVTPVHVNKGDIRKASSELEKASYETPPSSVSNRGSANSRHRRPLPAPPEETPNSFLTRTLEEARKKVAARSAADGNTDSSAKFEEVLATLEKIMPNTAAAEAEARRITSAPHSKPIDSKAYLSIINEEGRRTTIQGHEYRSFTAPVYKEAGRQQSNDGRTVRMVQQSSPAAPPMTRRHTEDPSSQMVDRSTRDTTHLAVPDSRMMHKKSYDDVPASRAAPAQSAAPAEGVSLVKKKSSWFRRWKEPQTNGDEAQRQAGMSSSWNGQDNRGVPSSSKPNVLVREKQPPHLNLSQATITGQKSSADENKGFSKWFSGWGQKRENEKTPGTASSNHSFLSASPPSPLPPTTPNSATEPQARSWFARFLRLRPETRTLAYSVPRARARSELFRLLRDWQRHGIKDLVYYPQENTITARVDKINSLEIKPVAFRIELFVVLQNGKKAGLSLARCEQVKGAASSFKKVIEVLEDVCREKGLLVEDEKQWKELCDIVD
ncbi:hypothetical protein AAFC00_003728 [Neodothiora populina]|uniref:non-specific serine/threonine protein kinase n=1 Tax=Neodothiora populina TaxID=2781224 RepID=A0ABR3PFA4_9PEZI